MFNLKKLMKKYALKMLPDGTLVKTSNITDNLGMSPELVLLKALQKTVPDIKVEDKQISKN